MIPVLSTRNSTLPALISLTAFAMSAVTVPVFGFGISPRGPSTLPSLPTARIMSGVATTASKSMNPPWIFSTISSPPTMSAPASWRFLLLLAAGDRQHALGLAEAVRQHDGAAHHLVGVLGIDAEPQRQLDGLVELRELDFLHERDRVFDRVGPIGGDLRSRGREFLAVFFALLTSCGANELLSSPTLHSGVRTSDSRIRNR